MMMVLSLMKTDNFNQKNGEEYSIMKMWIILLLSSFMFAQQTFSNEEVLGIANQIKELQYSDSIKTVQIENLEKQIVGYKKQAEIDSLLLQHKDFQIGILNERSKLYEEQVKLVKPKWYESKYIYWIQGSAIILIGSWVSSNVR